MSTAAGPMVPLRTGSCALRARDGSVSSNVCGVVLSAITAASLTWSVGRIKAAHGARARERTRRKVPAGAGRGGSPQWLLGRRRRRRRGGVGRASAAAVLLAELVHAPGGVDHLLLAGVER